MSEFEFGGSDWVNSHFGCMFGDDADANLACEDVTIGAEAQAAAHRFKHGKHKAHGQHKKPAHKGRFGEDETDADVDGVYGWLSGVQFGMVDDDVYGALVEAEETDPYALGI